MTAAVRQPPRSGLEWAALGLFALTLFLSIAMVKSAAGPLPLRLLTLLLCAGLLSLSDGAKFAQAAVDCRRVLLIIGAFAVLGLIVSVLAYGEMGAVAEQLVEIHIQAAVGVLIGYRLILSFGVAPVVGCFLGVFALSALLAIAQGLNIDVSWRLRAAMGAVGTDTEGSQKTYLQLRRAMGLSYSPVHFGTQTCLAFACAFLLRLGASRSPRQGVDWILVGVAVAMILLCVVTGNRSPLLGMVLFVLLYLVLRAPRMMLAALPIVLLGAIAAVPVLQYLSHAGVRAADLTNSSAEGRTTLRAFGMFLIEQRPIGYGLTFNSLDYWPSFSEKSKYLPNPLSFRTWAVHNYYITILAKYGILSLGLLPLLVPRRRPEALMWLAFVPYMVHIFYHNDGPLQGDFLIFFVLPAAVYLTGQAMLRAGGERPAPTARTWRRAFANGGVRA